MVVDTQFNMITVWRILVEPRSSTKVCCSVKYRICSRNLGTFDVEYICGFVWWGVCTRSRWRHSVTVRSKMTDIRCYGNVMTTTIWRLYVTMETLCQQQDGGYALFYIFNSTVIDWTCFYYFGRWKIGVLKICGFFDGGLDLGFIVV